MAELFSVQFEHRSIQSFQELEAVGGDAGYDDPAVLGLALAGNQLVAFHAIKEAGDIGVMRDHALTDTAAGQAIGLGAAKNAEDVVLGGGKAGSFEELLGSLGERVSGFEDGDEELTFEMRRIGPRPHDQLL
ncbi:MAG TPA: hypothetical protein VEJ47_01125 [Candidatus Eremiobacteraceae bacterium]|nr:hypothetical protein [Candidatus Eremiobacteraceae bacterium]